MKALGRHLLVEFYGCDTEAMDNLQLIENAMHDAARDSGATIVKEVFHRFNPFGISGVVVIAESHLTIHTWPEYGYAAVDLFTCGESVNPWVAFDILKERFKSGRYDVREIQRGMLEPSKESRSGLVVCPLVTETLPQSRCANG